jgi:hypothetical protein
MPFKEGDGKVIYYTCGSYGVPEGRFYQSDLCDAHQELAASEAEVEYDRFSSISCSPTHINKLYQELAASRAEVERLKKLCEMAIDSAEDALEERDVKRRIADEIRIIKEDLNKPIK